MSILQKVRVFFIRTLISRFELLFEKKTSRFYKKIFNKEPLLVIDVGANLGQTIKFFHKMNQMTYLFSFEPNPKLFKTLENKFQSNKNVCLINKGVSNKIGTMKFYENVLHESSTFEELNMKSEYLRYKSTILGVKPKNIVKDIYLVKVITLKHFIHCKKIKKIDVLKIDTEGHEFESLEGLFQSTTPPNIRVIQFEMHFNDMYQKNIKYEDIKDLLNLNGYYEIKRIRHGFGNFYDYFFSQEKKLLEI